MASLVSSMPPVHIIARLVSDSLSGAVTRNGGVQTRTLPHYFLEYLIVFYFFKRTGSSKTNHRHAVMVLILTRGILSFGALPQQLMVIAMYRSQVALIKRLFQHYNIDVAVNSVDSSEGKEAPIVIVDLTTPARKHSEIGFLRDQRRINVAFSRAMDGRIVLGSAAMANLPPRPLARTPLV
jgi:superfamily I DNA and/or RNA helicase